MAEDQQQQQAVQLAEQLESLAGATTALAQEVEVLRQWHPLYGSIRPVLWRGFVQGVASGMGRAVGATVLVAVLVWLLSGIQLVPVLGEWIAQLLDAIRSAQEMIPGLR